MYDKGHGGIEGKPAMGEVATAESAATQDASWPVTDGQRVVFLTDASSALEQRLLEAWIAETQPQNGTRHGADAIAIPSSRRRRNTKLDPRLEASLATADDPWLAPLRVAWFPADRDGGHAAQLSDLLTFGDPRDPGTLRQQWMMRRHPDRWRVVVGEPARASELRERWRQSCGADVSQTVGLAEFVARQATLALERAERRVRGARYKVPRFVYEGILAQPSFRGGIATLAREVGKSEGTVASTARRYLKEIAATTSPYVIDLAAHLIRLFYSQGYGGLRYDRRRLEEIYALGLRHPVVFLPTHKSNLDHLVLQYVLYETGHPPNHTAGGINMNFFPVGPLIRRSGVFFIRRTFKDNPIYKFVLRQYVDYLIEKRFSLEWYIEGGRSRSGKLLPPRFGMLAYVVDAFRRAKSEDVYLIPVAIAYDQIQDVGDYVAEQRGGAKSKESFGWFVQVVRKLRRNAGDIHIRFGEPLSLKAALGAPDPRAEPDPDERNLDIQKLAFEVAVRINAATPITPTSLVTLSFLGFGDRAISVHELILSLRNLVDYVRRRQLPTTVPLELDTPEGVRRAIEPLIESGVVTAYTDGPEPVYFIAPEAQHTAAYYRNTVIHFFVNGAIAELALLRAAEADVSDRSSELWDEALRLRDLLKFEFFFAEKDAFRAAIRDEIAAHDPEWEAQLAEGSDAVRAVLRRFRPWSSHRILRPFVESYQVVADALERHEERGIDESRFFAACISLGKQYRLQRRIRSAESISKVLFSTALRLARNRRLIEDDGAGDKAASAELRESRARFAAEIRDVIRRIDAIDALVASRRAGLIE
jgi:glycerol-3-phosphate O-acyltransferase